jgi:hypothetical protein
MCSFRLREKLFAASTLAGLMAVAAVAQGLAGSKILLWGPLLCFIEV